MLGSFLAEMARTVIRGQGRRFDSRAAALQPRDNPRQHPQSGHGAVGGRPARPHQGQRGRGFSESVTQRSSRDRDQAFCGNLGRWCNQRPFRIVDLWGPSLIACHHGWGRSDLRLET